MRRAVKESTQGYMPYYIDLIMFSRPRQAAAHAQDPK